MAKSLEELQLAFKAQYPRTKDKQPDEADVAVKAEEIKIEEIKTEEIKAEKTKTGNIKADITKEQKRGKASVLSDIIFYSTLVLIVIFAILFSRGAMGDETLGGFRMYEVLTTSMESIYPRGSLILIKQIDVGELVVGDDIAFAGGGNDLITHRIIEIRENHEATGKRAFITKGVDNAVADKDAVLAENVVGKVIKGIPKLGVMLRWVGENLWIAMVFFLSLMLLSFFIKKLWRESKKRKKLD